MLQRRIRQSIQPMLPTKMKRGKLSVVEEADHGICINIKE
ncbi:MAG: hypothetical protein OFPI_04950 [Osedax symbiont Rs2]|nr:MAG: hypothetical protein OFPI_04950 [Osedax symbiont Rs2]